MALWPAVVQYHPNAVPLLASGATFLLIATFIFVRNRRHAIPGAWLASGMLSMAALWALAYAVELLVVPFGVKVFFNKLQYVGGAIAPGLAFAYVVRHIGGLDLSDRALALLLVVPTAVVALIATNGTHELVWQSFSYDPGPPADVNNVTGPGYTLYMGYSLLMILGMVVVLLWTGLNRTGTKRRQVVGFLAALAAPGMGMVLTVLGYEEGLNGVLILTTLPAAAILAWTVGRYDLFLLAPIARRTTVTEMKEGVVVVNVTGRIVEANPAAERILGAAPLVGEAIETVADEVGAPLTTDTSQVVTLGDRHVEVSSSSLSGRRGRPIGTLVFLDDVTTLVERRREVERKNERLEEFASVVTHDLRNPLSLASGYLDLYRETGDPEHADRVAEALERADRLIDDVLAWSRSGRMVGETTTLEMSDLLDRVTTVLDGTTVTIEMADDVRILGNRDRVLQLLENLVRNSVEHASVGVDSPPVADDGGVGGTEPPRTVTVRVGSLSDGFYVEDDGPGIPETDREQVFEPKFSGGGGSGFGLAIVQAIAEAHGWTVRLTEGSDGGARFEFSGVETPSS